MEWHTRAIRSGSNGPTTVDRGGHTASDGPTIDRYRRARQPVSAGALSVAASLEPPGPVRPPTPARTVDGRHQGDHMLAANPIDVMLTVTDMAAAKHFYADRIGLEIRIENDEFVRSRAVGTAGWSSLAPAARGASRPRRRVGASPTSPRRSQSCALAVSRSSTTTSLAFGNPRGQPAESVRTTSAAGRCRGRRRARCPTATFGGSWAIA